MPAPRTTSPRFAAARKGPNRARSSRFDPDSNVGEISGLETALESQISARRAAMEPMLDGIRMMIRMSLSERASVPPEMLMLGYYLGGKVL